VFAALNKKSEKPYCAAPKARNMIARGKREARRPWLLELIEERALKVRNINAIIPLFQSFRSFAPYYPRGDAPRMLGACPGYHIPRLWRYFEFRL